MRGLLGAEDALAVVDALDEMDARPLGRAQSLGRWTALAGVAALLLYPVLTAVFGIDAAAVSRTMLAFGGAGVLFGAFLVLAGGGFTRGAAIGQALDAIEELERWDGSAEGRAPALKAATRLLRLYARQGRATPIYPPSALRERLGDKLGVVLAVERHLLATRGPIEPVFTELGVGGEQVDATARRTLPEHSGRSGGRSAGDA